MAEMHTDDLPTTGLAGKLATTNKRQEQQLRNLIEQATSLQDQLTAQLAQITALEQGGDVGEHTHPTGDIIGLGTAATKNTPASGDASGTEVVQGDDTRLTDDRDPNAHASDHASGGADPVDHDTLQNYDVAQHRIINDSGTSSVELWSADKISSELAAAVNNLDYKANVDTVATADITLSGEQTVNGVLTSGSRVGVVGQTDATQNGVYISSSGAWARATDCDDDDEVTTGLTFFVTDGDKTGFQYILITYNPITVGSTSLVFTEVRKLVFGSTAGTATEGNDPRVPAQDEKDALAGTGVPSSGNPYVTQDTHDAVDSRVTTNESDILVNSGNISTLQSDVSTNQSNISTNQSDISTLQSDMSTAQSDISTNQSNISTLQSDVSTAQSDISTNQSDISTLQSDVSTAQSDISTNQGNISTNQGNISTLQSDVSTAQSDISTNQGDISTLQSDMVAHGSNHQHGGVDEIATATPAANAIPKANGSNELDKDWLPAGTTSSKGALQLATNYEVDASKSLHSNDTRLAVICAAATTTDIDIDSITPADTYDGHTLATFDILLVANQTDKSENGVYVFNNTSQALSRVVGLNTSAAWADLERLVIVLNGSTQKGLYVAQETSGFTLDTDDLDFAQINIPQQFNGAEQVVKTDALGKFPASLIDGILELAELRGTVNPHSGAFPHQSYRLIENRDNSVCVYSENGMLFAVNNTGVFQVPLGLAVQKDDGEQDIEVVLADGTRVSVASLDGDEVDPDGLPMRPQYQSGNPGAFASPIMIQGRGF